MNRIVLLFPLLTSLWWTNSAAAQVQPQTGTPSFKDQGGVYEDIEIMRRLVNRHLTSLVQSCRSCHAGPDIARAYAFSPDGKVLMAHEDGTGKLVAKTAPSGTTVTSITGLDGMYVKGHGVVFQAQLPTGMAQLPLAATDKPAAKHPSEWEQIRNQLKGLTPADADKMRHSKLTADMHHLSVADVLVKLLADNSRNFTSLRDNDFLTIAVAFRPAEGAPGLAGAGGTGTPIWQLVPKTATTDAGKSTSQDYENLADLHLKQGRAKDALEALAKAISLNKDQARHASLYRKLAHAYLGLDTKGNDQEVIAKAMDFLKKAAGDVGAPVHSRPTVQPPTRLVVSGRKGLLDQVALGKMTLEELRRQITVEWIRPSTMGDGGPSSSTVSPGSTASPGN